VKEDSILNNLVEAVNLYFFLSTYGYERARIKLCELREKILVLDCSVLCTSLYHYVSSDLELWNKCYGGDNYGIIQKEMAKLTPDVSPYLWSIPQANVEMGKEIGS